MMMKKRNLMALFLALALWTGMIVPVQATGNLRLGWQQDGNSVELALKGLEGESVYGVQLQMIMSGTYTAAFTPAAAEAYSPECRVSSSDKKTRITLYVSSQKPLNSGDLLRIGGMTLSDKFTMPSTVTVTLLGHELRPLVNADGAVISASEMTFDIDDDDDDSGSSGGGGGSKVTNYRIQVSSDKNGEVNCDRTEAAAKSLVTLTATPKDRYELEELTVTSAKGGKLVLTDLGGGKYTFRMPAADVEVSAKFRQTGASQPETSRPPMSFSDVKESDWYHGAVRFAYERGIMSGTTETTFSPDQVTTRGMLVTILYRLEGAPEAKTSNFSDVSREMYYAKAVDWASENGIVTGYGGNEAGTFGPDNSITREQMATILYRYSQKKGLDMTVRGDLSGFTDQAAIATYARESMAWAVGMGLISGMGDGTVAPGGNAIRAQVATILMRYLERTEAKG